MEHSRRVNQIWSWLPAFRAVAETQHLPTASKRVHVSPSALSRTIKLLEEDFGRPLFTRVGRRLVLNDDGRELLSATRRAMRLVHEGVASIEESRLSGPVRVASSGVITRPYVLPALLDVQATYPEVVPALANEDHQEIAPLLLNGELDIAFGSLPMEHPELLLEVLGSEPMSVWCGPRHPLYGRDDVSDDELLSHPFTAPQPDALGRTQEGWPAGYERHVGLQVSRMLDGLLVCSSGQLLAALPDVVAREAPVPLWRLSFAHLPDTPLFCWMRPPVGQHKSVVELVLEAVRGEVARITQQRRR